MKTRLIPKLGEDGAARLQRNMTEYILKKISPAASKKILLSVYYTGATEQQMSRWLGESFPLVEQQGTNLGSRIADAFHTSLKNKFRHTLIIGSDCPAIDAALIKHAFKKTTNHNLVIGPTFDGGYYLIGLGQDVPEEKINLLFSKINWGTENVYQQTIAKAEAAELSIYTLPPKNDIDRPQDLEHFNYYSNSE